MQFDSFTYGLAIIFIPGILSRVLLGKLLYYKHEDAFHFIIYSFLLGVFSYTLLATFQAIESLFLFDSIHIDIKALNALTKSSYKIDLKEIIFASISSIIVASIVSFIENNKLITRVIQYIKITKRFSEPDVWSFLFNNDNLNKNPWVNIRDKEHNILYQGCVSAFSDNYICPELLLVNVKVFTNDTGDYLYDVDTLYLTLNPKQIEIESFISEKSENTKENNTNE